MKLLLIRMNELKICEKYKKLNLKLDLLRKFI